MWCNVGFADQLSFDKKCKEIAYEAENGKKKYKVVCGKTLRCSDTTYTINLEDQYISVSRGEDHWEINVVGDFESGIFYYAIYENSIKNNEYFFEGHFPDNPIVPGVIIVEAMAQTAGIVVSYKLREYSEKSVLFMSVSKAKFRKPILPNDNVCFEVKFLNKVRDVYKFYGTASKDNIKVSEAEFSAMITYR